MANETTPLSADQGARNQAYGQSSPSTVDSAAAAAKTTVDKVKEGASSLADHATEAARTAATQGKEKAAEAIDTVHKVVDNLATMVEEKVGPTYGKYARDAANGVSGFSESLKTRDVDALIADTRDFVRNNPMVAVGVASAVGFVLTRLVKLGADETSKV